MISKIQRQEISRALVQEANEDIVSLWLVQGWVQDVAEPNDEAVEIRKIAVSLILEQIRSGAVVVGSFQGDEFHVWDANADEVERRIYEMCDGLSRDFNMTDDIWLCAPGLNYGRLK